MTQHNGSIWRWWWLLLLWWLWWWLHLHAEKLLWDVGCICRERPGLALGLHAERDARGEFRAVHLRDRVLCGGDALERHKAEAAALARDGVHKHLRAHQRAERRKRARKTLVREVARQSPHIQIRPRRPLSLPWSCTPCW